MPDFNWDFPYTSQRMPILAGNVVATSQPLAAQAGLRMLMQGGNAADAALATAIALTVVEPAMNGIGSDAFCILWDGKELHGLNASGRAPSAWSPEYFAGQSEMPRSGWDTVTVPGCVSAWVEVSQRFGKLPFAQLFEPAIRYAQEGFLVGPMTAAAWAGAAKTLGQYDGFAQTFLTNGRAPKAGELFVCRDQARSLELIAETKGEAFYRGELADKIAADSVRLDGQMTLEDLAQHQLDWVGTISQDYRGFQLHEIPPNGQGLGALICLGILRHWPMGDFAVDSADSVHVQIEAMKLALADAYRYIADPQAMDVQVEHLLDEEYLRTRAAQIDLKRAQDPDHGVPAQSDTVYLTAADADGMMVSFIQSNYMGFGSGIVVPGTGISLQNRGAGFSLNEGHPNRVGPRKRPFHTIIPAFLMQGEKALMSFGVMGGPMQAQGHVQMVLRLADYNQNPQAAADAPRWQVLQGLDVAIEHEFPQATLDDLAQRGHQLQRLPRQSMFGGAQLIYRLENGYCAASEPRKEGQAVGF
ncbi:MAG: gamma-glutamyltransferase family protein [Candidatus Latescibacterota bacterium]|jgi:gamma-glutamyltranspeptidase/glutathione hydrolase